MAIGVILEHDSADTQRAGVAQFPAFCITSGEGGARSRAGAAQPLATRHDGVSSAHGSLAHGSSDTVTRVEAPFPRDFTDRAGAALRDRALGFRFFGNPDGPAVLALGGISGNADIADSAQGPGWWRDLIGAGGFIDLDRYCVIGVDYFPLNDPAPGSGVHAFSFTTADYARVLLTGLRSIGVNHLRAVIGGSFGGMIAQAMAVQAPDFMEKLVVLCASAGTAPLAHAWRRQQWEAIHLAISAGVPARGVALAREIAIATYRSETELNERFANRAAITGYLNHQGRKYADQVSAARYLALSAAVDSHEIEPASISVPTFLIAADSDRLVPLDDVKALARSLGAAHELCVVHSAFGHDSFLKDCSQYGPQLRAFLHGDD